MTKEELHGWYTPKVLTDYMNEFFEFYSKNELTKYKYAQKFMDYPHMQNKLNELNKIDLFYLLEFFNREDHWSYDGTLLKRIKDRDIQIVIERLKEFDKN